MTTYYNERGNIRLRRERLISASVILAAWTGLGVFSSLELHLESSFMVRKNPWTHSLFLEVTFTSLCALLTPLVLWLARRFRVDEKPYWRNTLIHLVGSALFTVIAKSIWTPMVFAIEGRELSLPRFLWSIVYSFDYCMVLYWVVLLASYVVEYYRRYQNGLLDAARLNAELAQAQLRWLKSRLHPHFLFNALNTISALVREDPSSAERMIVRLSELLRLSLRDGAVQEVSLQQEIEYLNMYLDIERTRFEDRLSIQYHIEEGLEDALVPCLVLQPIAENAIRHGIGAKAGRGVLEISASRHGSRLSLVVRDNGVGLRTSGKQPISEGVGLSTVRGRLETLYGRDQSLVLRNLPEGGVEARISMPYTTTEKQAPEVIHETV